LTGGELSAASMLRWGHQCGTSNVRDTHVLTPLFSAVVTRTMLDVECSRHSRASTTLLCCRYMDTRRQLLALKVAACVEPLMCTSS
jgi:hypothetical protein